MAQRGIYIRWTHPVFPFDRPAGCFQGVDRLDTELRLLLSDTDSPAPDSPTRPCPTTYLGATRPRTRTNTSTRTSTRTPTRPRPCSRRITAWSTPRPSTQATPQGASRPLGRTSPWRRTIHHRRPIKISRFVVEPTELAWKLTFPRGAKGQRPESTEFSSYVSFRLRFHASLTLVQVHNTEQYAKDKAVEAIREKKLVAQQLEQTRLELASQVCLFANCPVID